MKTRATLIAIDIHGTLDVSVWREPLAHRILDIASACTRRGCREVTVLTPDGKHDWHWRRS